MDKQPTPKTPAPQPQPQDVHEAARAFVRDVVSRSLLSIARQMRDEARLWAAKR